MSQFLEEEEEDNFNLVIPNVAETYNNVGWQGFWYNLSANENAIKIIEKYENNNHFFIDWFSLSMNKNAISILERNRDNIVWNALLKNEGAHDLLKNYYFENEENINEIDYTFLAENESKFAIDFMEEHFNIVQQQVNNIKSHISMNESVYAIDFMKNHPSFVDYNSIHLNKNAMEIIEPNLTMINWRFLCVNENAVSLLRANPSKIDWEILSYNKNAMDLLITNRDKINWSHLSKNENAVDFLKENREKIDWNYLSANKNTDAINLLKENPSKINWSALSNNKNKKVIPMLMKFLEIMMSYDPPPDSPDFPPEQRERTPPPPPKLPPTPTPQPPGDSVNVEKISFDLRNMRGNDLIEMKESFVYEHILKNSKNIVLVLNKDVILTNKTDIKSVFTRKTLVYECEFYYDENNKRKHKINKNIMYAKLGLLGFPVNYSYINAKYIQTLLKNKHQIYEFKETEKELESVISLPMSNPTVHDFINDPDLALGASHCQEGQEGKVFVMKQIKNEVHNKKTTLKELKQHMMKKEHTKKIKNKVLKELIARNTRKKYKNTKITDYFTTTKQHNTTKKLKHPKKKKPHKTPLNPAKLRKTPQNHTKPHKKK